jgi:hypothetical protein
MKNKPPQFDLPVDGDVFNLIVESAVDGQRAQQEIEAARTDAFLAKKLEEKQQPQLF